MDAATGERKVSIGVRGRSSGIREVDVWCSEWGTKVGCWLAGSWTGGRVI